MNKQLLRLMGIRYAIVIVLFIVIRFLMLSLIQGLDEKYYSMAPIILAVIFAPRLKKVETQAGNNFFLSFLFSSKVIK